ncbi:MAG: nicotinate-nucleotide adenylyltransferase [Anaerolineales bacterium]|nr:nicotinate-nucleotide adenylyltransferase [Anaerolineales bacterium]MCS7247035.1 nicotinate-nucleotide adenylyltransferase [Anaerolineales bacterium]MDW8160846.1 nicotinate-nucleotide adenylyltransferase [Anaerolineales bacterium]MDW8446798.1 nicotinate-nucleotide adenylyltransferase [Anaerolineales bacterium]
MRTTHRRVGVLGGTFDPIHFGHLILAEEALFQFELDCVLFLLTPFPPHKAEQTLTSPAHRLKMVELAVQDHPSFEISRVDLDRPPPHYAVDSVRIIRESLCPAEVFYLMGGDSLRDLPKWHEPQKFLQECDGLAVMHRSIEDESVLDLEAQLPGIAGKVNFLTAPRFDISSREIRHRVAYGLPFRYFLPTPVYRYILDNGLYRRVVER